MIAGGGVRAVLELAGIHDILSKSLGTQNPINLVKATVAGLRGLRTPEEVGKLCSGLVAILTEMGKIAQESRTALMECRDRDEAIEWSKRFVAVLGEGEVRIRPVM